MMVFVNRASNSYDHLSETTSTHYKLILKFKTLLTDSFLASIESYFGPIFEIFVKNGKLVLLSYGQMTTELNYTVSDGIWHEMKLIIDENSVFVGLATNSSIHTVVESKISGKSPPKIFMAKFGQCHKKNLFTEKLSGNGVNQGFIGCLADIVVNDESLAPEDLASSSYNIDYKCPEEKCQENSCNFRGKCEEQITKFLCTCNRPFFGDSCDKSFPASTFGYGSNKTFANIIMTNADRLFLAQNFEISAFFRTRQSDGLMFYFSKLPENHLYDPESYEFLTVTLNKGFIKARLYSADQLIELYNESLIINNGDEHFMKLSIENNQLKLYVNDSSTIIDLNDQQRYYLNFAIFSIGGIPSVISRAKRDDSKIDYRRHLEGLTNFKGTFRDVRIADKQIQIFQDNVDTENTLGTFGEASVSDFILHGMVIF